ncbi:hypothetical protein ACFSKT_00060 [Paenibacillus xanthanilyticus]|uniref:hypothetical protein n=1 Tax=Paenibacillus xanthanilyticus TaxID=1783531 RepID=UPI00363C8641
MTFTNPLSFIVLGRCSTARDTGATMVGVMVGFTVWRLLSGPARLWSGTAVGLCGGLLFACSPLLIKRWGGRFNVYVLVAYQMLLAGSACCD